MLTKLLLATGFVFVALVMLISVLTITVMATYWDGALAFLLGT